MWVSGVSSCNIQILQAKTNLNILKPFLVLTAKQGWIRTVSVTGQGACGLVNIDKFIWIINATWPQFANI